MKQSKPKLWECLLNFIGNIRQLDNPKVYLDTESNDTIRKFELCKDNQIYYSKAEDELQEESLVDLFLTNISSNASKNSSDYFDTLDYQFLAEDLPLVSYLLILCNCSDKYEDFVNKIYSNQFHKQAETVPTTPDAIINESEERNQLRSIAFKRAIHGKHTKTSSFIMKLEGAKLILQIDDLKKMAESSINLCILTIKCKVKVNRVQKSVLKIILNARENLEEENCANPTDFLQIMLDKQFENEAIF